jgi:AraC family transcriptional regulator of adaptative response / DNA-3-methyladenine glycosylase II
MPRLAFAAARMIAAGALNGHSVGELARELGVSERHLRRAVERELGVSPVALAQTHRLLLAKRLLADTTLSVTRIAFASGFQSLRRFNAAFRAQYRMTPRSLGRVSQPESAGQYLRLTLAYRPPFAWKTMCDCLARDAISGVDFVRGLRYGRTISIKGHSGVIFAEDAAAQGEMASPHGSSIPASRARQLSRNYLHVDVSPSLVPALMPLLARLRQMFDLDADPEKIDRHLRQSQLSGLVARTPGIRIPGAVDGFDVALRVLLRNKGRRGFSSAPSLRSNETLRRIAETLGEPIETETPELARLAPPPARVADAGIRTLRTLGVRGRRADAVVAVARLIADDVVKLEPGGDVVAARLALAKITGVGDQLATSIVMRAMQWPDAFPVSSRALARMTHVSSVGAMRELAERWRPWRTYAAIHLWSAGIPQ